MKATDPALRGYRVNALRPGQSGQAMQEVVTSLKWILISIFSRARP
jgi:hypothetical protein